MAVNLYISGALAIIVGLLILIFPNILRIAVGAYLLIVGILSFVDF